MKKYSTGFRAGGQPYPRKKPHHIKNLLLGKTVAREKPFVFNPITFTKFQVFRLQNIVYLYLTDTSIFIEVVTLAQQHSKNDTTQIRLHKTISTNIPSSMNH